MNNLILFPNQLFEKKYLPKVKNIFLLEDPIYFGIRENKLKFNKIKLTYHVICMKEYKDYLKKNKFNVTYLNFNDLKNLKYSFLKNLKEISLFDVTDHLLWNRLKKVLKNKVVEVLENPNYLMKIDQLNKYDETKKHTRFFHKNFYEFVKKELNILSKTKSYDNENRVSLPKTIKIPDLPKKKKSKYEDEAIKYINKNFKDNYGGEELLFPTTHNEAKKWVKYFCSKKLDKFGTYQDAIHHSEWFLFHSTISPMLNCGLINPDYVVKVVTDYYKKNKTKVKINNYEGFIRQILGWREYQRYCYLYGYEKMKNVNYFNHKKKLTKKWYTGETGIKPVDDAIKIAFKTGYLHHILRLMMMSNIMNLHRLDPDDCYKWFMEFAIDSYDWVMIQNVYSMGQWADGGLTMRKPYISSGNYILNMSNYPKGEWDKIWRALYYKFLVDHENKLKKTPYVRNLVHWKRMKKNEKDDIMKLAKKVIKDNTR